MNWRIIAGLSLLGLLFGGIFAFIAISLSVWIAVAIVGGSTLAFALLVAGVTLLKNGTHPQ